MPSGKHRKPEEIIGQTFHELTVISMSHRADKRGQKYRMLLCQCSCGKQKEIRADNLMRDKNPIVSCGHRRDSRMHYYGLQAFQYSIFAGNGYSDADLTFDEFIRLSQQNCYWCNRAVLISGNNATSRCKKYTWQYHGLDRKDNDLSHSKSNVLTACWSCNSMKGKMSHDEFKERINLIFHNTNNNA